MWLFNIDPIQLLWLLLAAAVTLVMLIVVSRWFDPLFVLASAFFVLAPFSQATESGVFILAIKWARIGCTAMIFTIGLFMLWTRGRRFGSASTLFLAFLVLYMFGSLWSTYPTVALAYKANVFLLMVGGMLMGLTAMNLDDLHGSRRALLGGILVWCVFLFTAMGSGFGKGRFDAYGINPNAIGMLSAFGFITALSIALNDRNWTLKMLAYGAALVQFVAVALTGSRAGFGALVLGTVALVAPFTRRPLAFTFLAFVLVVSGMLLSNLLSSAEGAERLLDVQVNSREHVWRFAFEQFAESPFIGNGWLSTMSTVTGAPQMFHTHSMYLQVLVDLGVAGFLVFFAALVAVVWRWLRVWAAAGRLPREHQGFIYLGCGWTLAALGLGTFESAPLGGTTGPALFFALSIGLCDRLWLAVQEPSALELPELQDDASYAWSPGGLQEEFIG